jgi:hypothetical protein
MPRTPAKVTQAEIARALRVAKAAGMTVEVRPDGTIRIVPMDHTSEVGYTGQIRL